MFYSTHATRQGKSNVITQMHENNYLKWAHDPCNSNNNFTEKTAKNIHTICNEKDKFLGENVID